MFHCRGGMVVGPGTYWNLANGERQILKSDGSLPGTRHTQYLKIPSIVFVLLGPVIGLFYVIFLPFIGLAMVAMLVTNQLANMLANAFGTTAAFGWRPVEAYLMSRRTRKKARRDAEQARTACEADDGSQAS